MCSNLHDAQESVEQLRDMWRALITDYGSGDIRDDMLSVRWAESKLAFYNCLTFAFSDVGPHALEIKLNLASMYMRAKENEGYLWVFKGLLKQRALADLDRLVEQAGLMYAMSCWGMANDMSPLPEPIHPALRFDRVKTVRDLEIYADLNARAYGLPCSSVREAIRRSRLLRESCYTYIAYEGDRPVSCASACNVHNRLFVALVATDPAAQRMGYGEAVTRKAIYEGARDTDIRRVTLHATASGRPIYERIGLRVTAEIALYTLPQVRPQTS